MVVFEHGTVSNRSWDNQMYKVSVVRFYRHDENSVQYV